jgi:zinc/manganese transport system permease protein
MAVHATWDIAHDIATLLSYQFMVNALRAGTVVAVVAGAVGYVMVLRRQTFAGHTLALVGFPGAAGAVWLGLAPSLGYYVACVLAALVLAAVPVGRGPASGGRVDESAAIGMVQAFALATGFLFISLYNGLLNGPNDLLFGTILGVSDRQVVGLLVAGGIALLALVILGRPLLFASVDADVARARGVPVRLVGGAFLVLLGVVAAGTSQVTGSLLVLALLVAPAATAAQLTARPVVGMLIAIGVAVAVTWVGECVAFYSPYPVGFWVTTFAFAAYLAARGVAALALRRGAR